MDAEIIDLTKVIAAKAVLPEEMEDLISDCVDADLVTDVRPDGILMTPFGARAATLLLHHVIEFGLRQGMPMAVPDDVGAAAMALERALNPELYPDE